MDSVDPSPEADDESGESPFVYCRSCGAKASADWSYCRSCEASLDDAVAPANKRELFRELYADEREDDQPGCPKCGHDEATVDLVETTGVAVTALIASQNERFRSVACTRCGYCEFYTHGDEEILIDLFFER